MIELLVFLVFCGLGGYLGYVLSRNTLKKTFTLSNVVYTIDENGNEIVKGEYND